MLSTFDDIESAGKAKATLHGADIYSNCCTIRAEYAKVGSLFLMIILFEVWIAEVTLY